MRRWLKVLAIVVAVVVVLIIGAGLWIRGAIHGSLPQLEGSVGIPGLTAEVVVERDPLGVPTIRGANREDAARALGFLHAQERFFQMDLLRRKGAGELSELFGSPTIETDKRARLHRFRNRAQRAVEAQSPGNPSRAYQKAGATTPSEKFSATLSMAARATPGASSLSGSRPTIWATAARPSDRPRSRPRATAPAWS